MAKRKRQDDPKQDEAKIEDTTKPAMDASAMMAAQDQFEAAKAGEANAPSDEVVPAEEPSVIPPPVDELPAIPLKVYVKIAGPKWDQMAGFLSHAKTRKFGPRTVPKWRAAYQAFLQMPMK